MQIINFIMVIDQNINTTRIILIIFCFIVFLLHVGLCITIRKARLKQNQYFLIQILSANDSIFVLGTIMVLISYTLSRNGDLVVHFLWELASVLVTVSGIQSFSITILLSVDRLIAVIHPLRYHSLVTKKRIVWVTSFICFFHLAAVLILFQTTRQKDDVLKMTQAVQIQQLVNRFIVVITLLSIGAIIKRIRAKSEKRIRNITGDFQQSQSQTATRTGNQPRRKVSPKISSLKQSVRDILVLNWWTVLFVMPRLFTLTIMTTKVATERLRTIDAVFAATYTISNPFVYAFTQGLLRKKLKSWFCTRKTSSSN
ncbi:somatostatin receptor type 4-like [Clytia hemisphaerica]|uniref:somatostatin receptor type 4-like n=1 Tax=Clytia hemisphaerica TaxID=252671 RepID=UPI0034D5943A